MTVIRVEGMTCGHCAGTVKKAAEGAAPEATATVDLSEKTVTIDGAANAEAVKAAIRDAGYQTA